MESLKESGILTNFLGAITDSLVKEGYSPDDVHHLIVASLMEIIEDETKNADNPWWIGEYFCDIWQNILPAICVP